MVYLFLGTGFEEVEAIATIDVLRRAEVELTTVSVMEERIVEGAHGVRIEADKMFDEVDCANAQMLILPGGMPGTLNLGAHEGLAALLRDQNKKGRWIAAICAAPSILGHKGLLDGKSATCFPGFEEELFGANVSKDFVVKDGNIITAKGMGSAIEFGLQIAEILTSTHNAQKIRASLQIYNG